MKKNDTKELKISKVNIKRFRTLLTFMLPRKYAFIGGLSALVISSLGTLAFPMLFGDLLDAANPSTSLDKINEIVKWLFIIFVINAVFSFLRIYLFAEVTQYMLAKLRQTTYNHLIRLPMSFFSTRRVGELNSRISSDISILQETFTFTIAQFVRQIITITGGIVLLSLISAKLTLFMLAFVPFVALGARYFGKFIKNISQNVQDQVAQSNVIVEETLQGIAIVKAFANEMFEFSRYSKQTNDVVQIAMRGAIWRALFISTIIFVLFSTVVGVIWFGVYLVNQGAGITSGELFKFILYTLFIGASISGMADLYSQIQKALGATESLLTILDEKTEEMEFFDPENNPIIQGNIRFENIEFAYPSRPESLVLNSITFEVLTGKKVALVGSSGAGKTTITALLMRFYEPSKGKILIDSIPISNMNLHYLRNQMALVPQEVLLFGGTIAENIAYGKPEADFNEIREAAQRAHALEFIESFPEQFATLVGERGIQLSGGQRQRIAIARAILKNPKILILDEATSALDNASENHVKEALDELMANRTSIIIAHRLSTIQGADLILVLDNGCIVESGQHQQLIQKHNGIYQSLLRGESIQK